MTVPTEQQLAARCGKLSLEEKIQLLTGRDSWSTWPMEKIGLHSIVMSDGPAGVRGDAWDERSPSINLPSPTAAAAAWDRRLIRRYGEALGSEATRKNVHVVLGPTINIQRTPYGGRHFEAFSEDPVLTGILAAEYVKGVQSFGVGATIKHYIANDSETDRFTVDVQVDERTLREVYLLAFEEPIVHGGSWLVMSAYNSVNGASASENVLLETPLNAEWAFDGLVVSDWTAVRSLESAKVPQDLAMPGPSSAWSESLIDAVRAGEIDEALIDRKVVRLLRLAARVGALHVDEADDRAAPLPEVELRDVARESAIAGTVLLKNDGILPLVAPASIAVIGEGAVIARTQGGGSATVIPSSVVTPLEGVRAAFPDSSVTWAQGAVVQRGLADLADGTFTSGGVAGMAVKYYSGGALLAEEVRRASGIVSFDAHALAAKSDLIEFTLTYAPGVVSSSVALGVAGLCDFEVLVGGSAIATGELRLDAADDPAAAVLHPPSAVFTAPIEDGRVDLTVRFVPKLGEMGVAMSFRVGTPPSERSADELIAEAVAAAGDADVAIVVVSTSSEVESEGFDRNTLALPGTQDALVRAIAAANPRTVVVVNTGAPVTLPWRHDVAAILSMWFPGQEFGHALGDVLTGASEPRGRLPMTWPDAEDRVPVSNVAPRNGVLNYAEGIHVGYRAWLRERAEPAYSFGFGLGYTTWDVESVEVVDDARDDVSVRVTVRNTGPRAGSSVVQAYLRRESESSVDRPERWLAGFEAVSAEAGESVDVAMEIPRRRFAHWDGTWSVEPGEFALMVGFSSDDIRSTVDVAV
ncbi:glycoside hydrolase family 3 C-terminal domain-containing protein [Microbacterium aoyamense]|uniref:Glycoside hydrolase family 3 C-terminal domain-containing protein n=1 Tax=Microbacterium aoyamense TaxID=344166 RepID=A0ABN2PBR1_9MICO|nr:glycoside hydrolase family 3 C-terminal domain-containing protein [Microbacterium aoyamense]